MEGLPVAFSKEHRYDFVRPGAVAFFASDESICVFHGAQCFKLVTAIFTTIFIKGHDGSSNCTNSNLPGTLGQHA